MKNIGLTLFTIVVVFPSWKSEQEIAKLISYRIYYMNYGTFTPHGLNKFDLITRVENNVLTNEMFKFDSIYQEKKIAYMDSILKRDCCINNIFHKVASQKHTKCRLKNPYPIDCRMVIALSYSDNIQHFLSFSRTNLMGIDNDVVRKNKKIEKAFFQDLGL